MSTRTCRRGHPLTGANRYERPTGVVECWVCKLRERFAYWATQDSTYQPGPGALEKLDRLRAEGLWGAKR
jgi:hypothetical protein